MYKLAMFSQNISAENNIFKLYHAAIDAGIIDGPIIFCDDISIISPFPYLHTSNLMGKNYLVLTDNSVFKITDVYDSNKFICIDVPCRFSSDAVDLYNIEEFMKDKDYVGQLKNILNRPEYNAYVIQ